MNKLVAVTHIDKEIGPDPSLRKEWFNLRMNPIRDVLKMREKNGDINLRQIAFIGCGVAKRLHEMRNALVDEFGWQDVPSEEFEGLGTATTRGFFPSGGNHSATAIFADGTSSFLARYRGLSWLNPNPWKSLRDLNREIKGTKILFVNVQFLELLGIHGHSTSVYRLKPHKRTYDVWLEQGRTPG